MTKNLPLVVWLTGEPCGGKTSLALKLLQFYRGLGIPAAHLDGDKVRSTINNDLTFLPDGTTENLRRVAHLCKYLMYEVNVNLVICSFVSPAVSDRLMVKNMVGAEHFIEVYVRCDRDVRISRDVKGMYEKARKGELKNFVGYDRAYEMHEERDDFEFAIDTSHESINESYNDLVFFLSSWI